MCIYIYMCMCVFVCSVSPWLGNLVRYNKSLISGSTRNPVILPHMFECPMGRVPQL